MDANEFIYKPTIIYGFADKTARIPKGVEVLLALLMVLRPDYFVLVEHGLRFQMTCLGLDLH